MTNKNKKHQFFIIKKPEVGLRILIIHTYDGNRMFGFLSPKILEVKTLTVGYEICCKNDKFFVTLFQS